MVSVGVTGVSGLVGRRVAARLVDNPGVDRVLGLDVAHTGGLPASSKLALRVGDVRDPALAEHLEGCDTVVHLAFQLDQPADVDEMRAVNVEGTRNVFQAAVKAGASKVVYTSSGVVYGGHPDNDFSLTEDSPLRANPDFPYAEHKLEVERWLWPWAQEHPELAVVVLRPAIVAGREVNNFIVRQLLEFPRYFAVKGYRPPSQFAHVDDVASAVEHAVLNDLQGPYNVACEGWLSFEEMLDLTRQKTVDVPEAVAFPVVEWLWRLGFAQGPPGALHYLMHPWVMSVERLCATGWQPRHTNREALEELAADHAGYLSLRRNLRVRKRDLAVGGGLFAAVLTALGVRRALSYRRGRVEGAG